MSALDFKVIYAKDKLDLLIIKEQYAQIKQSEK